MPRILVYVCTIAALITVSIPSVRAENFDLSNDFGDVGLLQTPTARMAPDGEFGFGVSIDHPYNQLHLTLQFLPWLETTFRYTDITNRRYGPASFSGTQSLKDKSADFKIRLLQEKGWVPAVAIGVQDIGGTGLFSSEYLVASHSYGNLDFSLGLGWGRLGSAGNIPNPFGVFGAHFRQPHNVADSSSGAFGGNTGISRLFTGRDIGFFGGVRWQTPLHGLYLDLEYDGNDFKHEAENEKLSSNFPLNVGLTYRILDGVEIGAGYERGNTLAVRLILRTNFQTITGPGKTFDPPPPPVVKQENHLPAAATQSTSQLTSAPLVPQKQKVTKPVQPGAAGAHLKLDKHLSDTLPDQTQRAQPDPEASSTPVSGPTQKQRDNTAVIELTKALALQKFTLQGTTIDHQSHSATLWYSQPLYRNPAKAVGRVARIMSELLPGEIRSFTIIQTDNGMDDFRATIQRADLERATDASIPAKDRSLPATLSGPTGSIDDAEYLGPETFPRFSYDTGPQLRQNVGGPDGFYLYQFWWRFTGNVQLTRHFSLTSSIGVNIYNNFDKLKQQSNSKLPHVRSDIGQYLKQGKNNLVNLYGNYIWSPAPSLFARVSAGIFEEEYAGVAAELLYRPFGQRWAVGVDVNRVRQRAFNQRFSFRHYTVTTGFVSFYYEMPYQHLFLTLTGGRYLARDYGGTVSIAHEFDSGVVFGAFVTKTNVSAQQFGEGSFDKGLFLSIPLDLGFPASTRRRANIAFKPLTRDGGQRAFDGPSLYGVTGDSDIQPLQRGWGDALQ